MSTTRMRLGALVTAGVLTFGLGACGGDDSTTDPTTPAPAGETAADDAAEDTADDTADETTDDAAAETTEDTADAGAEGEEIPVEDFIAMIQEPGEETLSSYTMTMSMALEGQTMEMDGAMDLSGDSPAMRINMAIPDLGSVEMLMVDGSMYMAMPGLTEEGKYIVAPPELASDTEGLEDIDVSAQWDAWEEGAQSVVFLGTEDVDGTEMRRYQLTVDPDAVNEAMESAAEDLGDDALATEGALTEPVVYDVWLDGDNLMRQMVMEIEGTTMEMTMDNWGEDPGIEAPAPEDITDMNDLGTGATG